MQLKNLKDSKYQFK